MIERRYSEKLSIYAINIIFIQVGAECGLDTGIWVAIGIAHGQDTRFFGSGQSHSAISTPPTPDTFYEIGSVTKVFTAALLAHRVTQAQMSLDQPIHQLLPWLINIAPSITLRQLATHTSGLPHLPRNIIPSFLKNWRNPYQHYTIREFAVFLKNCRVNPKNVGKIHYSNLGMGLLGYILTELSGKSYDATLQAQICQPLNLTDTRTQLSATQQSRLAQPYNGSGKPTSQWDFHRPLAGAGAIRSTTADLLHFVAVCMLCRPSALDQALRSCLIEQEQTYAQPGIVMRLFNANNSQIQQADQRVQHIGIGLGWFQTLLTAHNQTVW